MRLSVQDNGVKRYKKKGKSFQEKNYQLPISNFLSQSYAHPFVKELKYRIYGQTLSDWF